MRLQFITEERHRPGAPIENPAYSPGRRIGNDHVTVISPIRERVTSHEVPYCCPKESKEPQERGSDPLGVNPPSVVTVRGLRVVRQDRPHP